MYKEMLSGIKKISNHLLGINRVTGIEVIILPDNEICFHYVDLSIKKELLQINSFEKNINSLEELKSIISCDVPVSIVMTGKGILHKKVDSLPEADIIQNIFPNAKPDDFFIQQQPSTHNSIYVSVIRKEIVEEIERKFTNLGLDIIGVSLGPFCVNALFPLLNMNSSPGHIEFNAGEHNIIYQSGLVQTYSHQSKQEPSIMIQIGRESIPSDLLVAFGSAFECLTNKKGSVSLSIASVDDNRTEYTQKNIFDLASKAALIFFFVILLVNYILLMIISDTHNTLRNKIRANSSRLNEFELLESKVKNRKSILNELNWQTSSYTSYYADQIGLTIPKNIVLTELLINPLNEERSGKLKLISFKNDLLIVNGKCKHSSDLDKWLKTLKKKEWIKDIEIQNFIHKDSDSKAKFSIEITLA